VTSLVVAVILVFGRTKLASGERDVQAVELDEELNLAKLSLCEATSKLPNSKAPGEDAVVAEWVKELLPFRREDGPLSSPSVGRLQPFSAC